MKKHLFSPVIAAILCFGLSATLASAEEIGLKLYGKNHPFTIEQLPAGELKTKLQQLEAPAREAAMTRLHKISFHEFDAAKHLRADNQGGIYSVCSGSANCVHTGCNDATHDHAVASGTQESALKDLTDKPTVDDSWDSPKPPVMRAPVPIASPPAYNSRPGAPYHIYLDFNGAVVTGKAWNDSYGVASWDCLPWSSDGDRTTFSDAEQEVMFQTWQRMAEDFAPFNVNVTTDPAYDPVTYAGDKNKVGWILHTPTKDKNNKQCPHDGAGGVAYLDVFGDSNYFSTYQPAWTAIQDGHADTFAEVSSHEIGHNFGLSHDGRGSSEYYLGHGTGDLSWAPLMGAGYGQNMTQWSRGEYSSASESQDDLTIIASKLGGASGYRTDDHADTLGAATPLTITGNTSIFSTNPQTDPTNSSPENKGVIEKATDVDVFSFETGDGAVTINVDTWKTASDTNGNNLDVSIELQDSNGDVVASASPSTDPNATFTVDLTAGNYFLFIRNSGAGTPMNLEPTGYSSYGSLGQYFISGTIQEATPRLRVLSITPDEGENNAPIEVVITGRLFEAATAVSLKRTGSSDIVGTVLELVSTEEMRVSFNISGAAIGEWDLFASNPSLETDTLVAAFTVTLPIADFFDEDFDGSTSMPAGWKTYSTTEATPLWQVTSTSSHTPAYSARATALLTTSTKYLESPPITLPAAAIDLKLSFWQYCNMENGYDGGVLEFSVNGGEWFDVITSDSGASFESNGYNNVIPFGYRSPIAGRYAWTGNSKGYVQTVVNLTNAPKYAGKTLRIRWLLATDNSAVSGGWNVDSISLTGSYDPDYDVDKVNPLTVTASDDLSFSGKYGGRISPSSQSYTLTNTGSSLVKWTASKNTTWVTISSTGGTLAPGDTTKITVNINTNSIALPAGTHSDTLSITNLSLLDDVIKRGIRVTIIPTPATVTISNLKQVYDGELKSVTVSTDPAGLPVDVTYNGKATRPRNAGIYDVVATINHSRYAGTAIGVLKIAKVIPTIKAWPKTPSIPFGQPVSAATLMDGKASVPGSFRYDIPDPILQVGTHSVPVTFIPNNLTNYTTVSGKVTITVYPTTTNLVRTTVNNVTNTSWKVVNLGKTYRSPVIVATPIYGDSTLPPVVTRIRNVTSTSFELRLARADGSKGSVSTKVAVLAVDEGVYTIAQQGVKMEAVKFKSTLTASGPNAWVAESRAYQNTYTNPVVIGQVMSSNDRRWSAFWSMGATRTSPANATALNLGKHVGLDHIKTRANEKIGYIVIEAGKGKIDGVRYRAQVGQDIVRGFGNSAKPYKYGFLGLNSVSTAAISQTGMDGEEGSWAVMSGKPALNTTTLKLHIAEDGFNNKLRKHTTEQVAFIVFE